jgi:hypothetical protein
VYGGITFIGEMIESGSKSGCVVVRKENRPACRSRSPNAIFVATWPTPHDVVPFKVCRSGSFGYVRCNALRLIAGE